MCTAGHAEAWNRAALHPPRAHGAPLPSAEFKSSPDDFRVEEQLSFIPSGSGPHWLVRVEKRGANTRWVAAELARQAQVPANDVGFAGLKDRHAVTVQWFSVPVRSTTAEYWSTVAHRRVSSARGSGQFAKTETRSSHGQPVFASACAGRPGPVNNWT